MALEAFVAKHLELLNVERDAEIEGTRKLFEDVPAKELQRRGVCLLQLQIASCNTGLFNRCVVCFESMWSGKELPANKFSSGDIAGVGLLHEETKCIASGVVTKTSSNSISVAFEENYDQLGLDDNTQYKLTKLANDVTYRRLKSSLKDLRNYHDSNADKLIEVLFGERKPSDPLSLFTIEEPVFFNKLLDNSQKEAVLFALNQREIAIIHGPPGTGKTTTLTEIILQAAKLQNKILVCAPSNIAVDNIIERLCKHDISIVRLGHPAKVMENIQHVSLDAILASSDEGRLLNDIRKEIDDLYKGNKKIDKQFKGRSFSEIRTLRKELRNREAKATKELLQRSSVVLSTLTSAYDDGPLKCLQKDHFDLLVIDECSQAIEAACWIPMLKVSKCILAGDHYQLPPTIISEKAAKDGLEISLMERQSKLYGDIVTRMLTLQYRMHVDIMKWSSEQFYKGKLEAHSSVATHLLRDLPGVKDAEVTSIPLLLIDTAGCDILELEVPDDESKGNEGEADLAVFQAEKLISNGVNPKDIAIVTPYNLQVELVRQRISGKHPELEIKSVDGFQGREKEAVIISMVRSNCKAEIGFLAEIRRMNVAVTRARRHLTVICDSLTVSSDPTLQKLIDHLTNHGEIRSAHEYSEVIGQNDIRRPKRLEEAMSKEKIIKETKKKNKIKEQIKYDPPTVPAKANKENPNKQMLEHFLIRENYIRQNIMEQIEKFQNDSAETYSFPPNLSSYERRLVHEIAEEKKLQHSSQGDGRDRYIEISKIVPSSLKANEALSTVLSGEPMNKNDKNVYNSFSLLENEDAARAGPSNDKPDGQKLIACNNCLKSVPENNFSLHQLRCPGNVNGTRKKKIDKPKKIEHEEAAEALEDEDADFDRLIAAAIKQNTKCHFGKCKTSTATLGQNCQFCNQRFCLSHFIPEIHGCGNEARIHARRTMLREGVVHSGSGVPNKKPNPVKRSQLQRKLNKKLNEMADQRKPKKDPQ